MIPLAAIEGKFIFFIVFAAVGAINWWLEQRKKNASPEDNRPSSQPSRRATPIPSGESEQERLRRFLEALGVPQQPGQTQSPTPPPRQIAPPPVVTPRPAAMPAPAPAQRRVNVPKPARPVATPRVNIPRPRPAPVRQFVPEPEEMQYGGRLEEPAAAIETILQEFRHTTVSVAMPPVESLAVPHTLATGTSDPAIIVRRRAAPLVESLRATLRTRSELRRTFVAMELLGTPRGLQS